ncbi:unnamed protein product [Closterium sp. NIES-53]
MLFGFLFSFLALLLLVELLPPSLCAPRPLHVASATSWLSHLLLILFLPLSLPLTGALNCCLGKGEPSVQEGGRGRRRGRAGKWRRKGGELGEEDGEDDRVMEGLLCR